MDYEFGRHLALRLFQADYQFMHVDFGGGTYGGRASINAARLSTGVVFHLGSVVPPTPVSLACFANPTSVYPGTDVTVTCTPGSLNPKMNAIYSYSGAGAQGKGTTATVNTSALAPGSYTVQGTVKEGKPGKEGVKPWENALGSATFTVKAFEPPTISCSANPSTIKPGDTSTITCNAVSPQNLPLTYTYSASAGTITGNGSTAVYSSSGAPTGAVGITGKVSDNKGNNASADTSVTIEAPPPPPQPHAQALCSISFTNDKRRPTRVDNEAKACLDQIAIDLQQQPDAKAVVVGESDAKEKATTAREEKYQERHPRANVTHFAAQRAVNAKDYLVTEKGIDPSRVSAATTGTDGQSVQDYLVPAGANFETDVPGTTPVNESQVKPQKRVPLPQRHHR
jgi:outer membrane protein OmpA-like peptidoglycan-associated protein